MRKSSVVFALCFAAFFLYTCTSCTPYKEGCPGAKSQGRVPGKFKS